MSNVTQQTSIMVDAEKCIRCGFCSQVCPSGIIKLTDQGPVLFAPKACIGCGHCVAVCPHAALDHSRNSLHSQVEVAGLPLLTVGEAEMFLRGRRSIRAYRDEQIAPEVMQKLLKVARYAPSGGNSQGVSFMVFSDPSLLKQISAAVIDWLEEQIRQEVAWTKPYAGMAKIYRETGYDVVLRGAPHLVLALAAMKNPIGRDNGRYALTYAELFAPALGLGSCWAGFFEMGVFGGYDPLIQLLGIPETKTIAGALMIGKPKFRYQRLVERNPLEVVFK